MASTRVTIASALDTVTAVVNSVGSIANTITTGIESVNDLVVDLRSKQQERLVLTRVDYTDALLESMSEEIMKRTVRIEDYLSANPTHAPIYQAAHDKLVAALEAHRNPAK